MSLDADGLRIVSRRELARAGRGALAHLARDRDLVGELLDERRAEVARERSDAPVDARRPHS